MKKVRFAVIGLGYVGKDYARDIAADQTGDMCLAAVCTASADKARQFGAELSVPAFTDADELYASGLCNAVLIATPHYLHPPLAIRAARAGLHVLSEKPLAVTVGPARAMIAECRRRKMALAAMLQLRTRGIIMKMKQMVDCGEVGEVFRISMVCSGWYRPQAYYGNNPWRGTWDGDGGGVLINQAPHSLDQFIWIGGMPNRVQALLATRLHRIEVENTANIICDYGGGRAGYFYASTADASGINQIVVCGDKGTLVADGEKLRFGRLPMPLSLHLRTCKVVGADDNRYEPAWEDVTWTDEPGGKRMNIIRNFAAHLLRGERLIADGEESIKELELSNAAYLSAATGKCVDIPVDAAKIERLMNKLEREHSTGRGGGLRAKADRELAKLPPPGRKTRKRAKRAGRH